MAVYVDRLMNWGWRLGPNCHMTADTLDELHAMAARIGLKRSWFQGPPKHALFPHYDLVDSKRMKALLRGAVDVSGNEHEHITYIRALYGARQQREGLSNVN